MGNLEDSILVQKVHVFPCTILETYSMKRIILYKPCFIRKISFNAGNLFKEFNLPRTGLKLKLAKKIHFQEIKLFLDLNEATEFVAAVTELNYFPQTVIHINIKVSLFHNFNSHVTSWHSSAKSF